MKMKFNYEFEFDVDEFVEYIEEDYFYDNVEVYNEELDKNWLENKLYNLYCVTDSPSIFIILKNIEDNTKKYYPQIIDRAYEILEEKRKTKEALKVHLKAIKEYCENQRGETRDNKCPNCPFYEYCGNCVDNWEL